MFTTMKATPITTERRLRMPKRRLCFGILPCQIAVEVSETVLSYITDSIEKIT